MNNDITVCTLADCFRDSLSRFAGNESYRILNGESLTYETFGEKVRRLTALLEDSGIGRGEKIAVIGNSMPNWPVSYWAVTTSARVAVPLLQDFTAFEIANILEHSGAKAIIIANKLAYKLSDDIRSKLDLIVCMDTLEPLKKPDGVRPAASGAPVPEDIASIIYTSGTSGASKGVMLTHANLTAEVQMCQELFPITQDDKFLSFLPLSHAYECSLGMLFPFTQGASVTYLDGPPTPSRLLPALTEVKPSIIISVPLIVEKLYKNKIRPMFTRNWFMQFLYSLMPVRRLLHRAAGKKLLELFGGNLRFFGIGGSKLDGMVERFLRDAGFPYGIGYGLTECSPLLAGAIPGRVIFQSTGPKLRGLELKIHEPNRQGIGEIVVKGPTVMRGYYNDPAKTRAAFTPDGWFRTKDLGRLDRKGNLYIKGRVDNMLLGSNGENIYPEEIESVINENDFVLESLVTKLKDRIVAKVHFNYDQIAALKEFKEMDFYKKESLSRMGIQFKAASVQERLEKIKKEIMDYVNERVNKSSRIAEIIEQPVPFEKTATQKIKRYLYT